VSVENTRIHGTCRRVDARCVAFSFEIQEAREGLVSGETEQNPVALYLFETSGKSSVQYALAFCERLFIFRFNTVIDNLL